MDYEPLSKTTGSATQRAETLSCPFWRDFAHRRAARVLTRFLLSLVFASSALVPAACSAPGAETSDEQATLRADSTMTADLDGDDVLESVLFDSVQHTLTIVDGDIVYTSRRQWQVLEATIGDTDHDSLPEVVALLDSEAGRHVGLFAYHGGRYRERLVTAVIEPAPLALEIVRAGEIADVSGLGAALEPGGDLIALVFGLPDDESTVHRTLLRWNGFGFTRIETSAPVE